LLYKERGCWEALTVELDSLNYAKVGAKMMNLEGNEVDVYDATTKGPGYIYLRDTTFLPIPKEVFNNPPRGEEEEV
jgi:hypothetical protein